MSNENNGPVRVAGLDEISESLLGALAEREGVSRDEMAGRLLRQALTEIARETARGDDEQRGH